MYEDKSKIQQFYDKLPWIVQASNPILLIAGIVLHLHLKFHFNLMEFLGVTFCVITTLYWIIQASLFLYQNWLGVVLGHSFDVTKAGSWAVVTGATQGIGLAYAHALGKRGLNLVLLSRSLDKLNEVAQEIRAEHQVEVKVLAVDFTGDREIYKDVKRLLADLSVGVLVNNVGMCYAAPEYFTDLPDDGKFCQNLINCNILSVTLMTHMVLPGMVERKCGVVINVGSLSSVVDVPFLTLYGASKVFVDKFTTDLELEYQGLGIIFQSVIPGYVVSSMSKIKESTFWVPSAEDFVDGALKALGLQNRTAVVLPHQLLYLVLKVGHFFRRSGAAQISLLFGRQFYLYGKRVMIYRSKRAAKK